MRNSKILKVMEICNVNICIPKIFSCSLCSCLFNELHSDLTGD